MFSGAGYLEACFAALNTLAFDKPVHLAAAITCLSIPAPLMLPKMEHGMLSAVVLECSIEAHTGDIRLASRTTGATKTTHITASAAAIREDEVATNMVVSASAKSAVLVQTPLTLRSAVAQLDIVTRTTGFYVYPAAFDCFLQVGQVLIGAESAEVFVPAGVGALRYSTGVSQVMQGPDKPWTMAQPIATEDVMHSNFTLYSGSANGAICNVSQLEAKSMGSMESNASTPSGLEDSVRLAACLYQADWFARHHAGRTGGSDLWSLSEQFTNAGEVAVGSIAVAQSALQTLPGGNQIRLQIVATNAAVHAPAAERSVGGTGTAVAALTGLVKCLDQECPQLSWSQSSVDAHDILKRSPAKLFQMHAADADAFGCIEQAGAAYESFLQRSYAEEASRPYHLMPDTRGSLNALKAVPVPTERSVTLGKIVVQVRAVGINFRDVLNVLGMYPGDPGPPGGDCAGVLLAGHLYHQGKPIAGPGDAVFGLASGSLGSHVIASTKTMVPMPAAVTYEEASTMPTVFVTVTTALNGIAEVKEGQRVLLHAAAGGVGLAAMQILQAAQAKPLVTVGNPTKRSMLRAMGTSHAFSSRSIVFAEELVTVCGTAHAALNTLTSTGMVASTLATLSACAHLIEISKRDIWCTNRVLQERPDVQFSLLAVDFMSAEALHASLMRISEGLSASTLRPLPIVGHDMRAVVAALRQMSQARHIGKIVVGVRPYITEYTRAGTVWVTGGTGNHALTCQRYHQMHQANSIIPSRCHL